MIINLTQHATSKEQLSAGVYEPEVKTAIRSALTFSDLPTSEQIFEQARLLAQIASGIMQFELGGEECAAMIGGAPFLMSALEQALIKVGITPCYAFSRRESLEEVQPDNSIRKVAIFRHLGFVTANRE